VEIVGEPGDGPTYADGATWSVEDGLSDDGEEEPETEGPTDTTGSDDDTTSGSADDTDDDSGSGRTVALVAGVGGLAALLGAFFLWRRRPAARSRSA
jgi:Ca-activated chloride channel family protein